MEQIKNILINEYGFSVDDRYTNMYARNKLMLAAVVPPHEGTDFKWMLRFSTVAAFDRWANSRAIEEFFESKEDVEKYLRENKVQIYTELLEYLSREYKELWKDYVECEEL